MLFGILLVAYYTVFEYFGRGKRKEQERFPRWQRLALVLLGCVVGALINPNTLDAVMYPFQLGKLYSESILKANSVIELQSLSFGRIPAFWFSVFLTVIGALLTAGRINWRHLVLLIALIMASIYRLRLVEIYVPVFLAFAPGLIQAIPVSIASKYKSKPALIINGATVQHRY